MRASALAPERVYQPRYKRYAETRVLDKRPAFFIDGRRIRSNSINIDCSFGFNPPVELGSGVIYSAKMHPLVYTISWVDNDGSAYAIKAQLERSVHRKSGRMIGMFTTQIDEPVTCIIETVSEV